MVIHRDKAAVGRHKNTIIDCLKDPDVSIRKRAMELIFDLVDADNVRSLAREMLNYLVTSKDENRSTLCQRITSVIEDFAPTPQWHVETLITMMSIGGTSITAETVSRVVRLITRQSDLQAYLTHKLYRMLSEDLNQLPLTKVGIWTIGEYGENLLEGCNDCGNTFDAVEEDDIFSLLKKCTTIYFATESMKAMALTALTKLAARFHSQREKIEQLISSFKRSSKTDLQQRSIEYLEVLSSNWESIRSQIQAPVPPMPEMDKRLPKENVGANENASPSFKSRKKSKKKKKASSSTDDILGVFGSATPSASVANDNADDLLAGIFGGDASPAPNLSSTTARNTKSDATMLDDIFGSPMPAPAPAPAPAAVNGLDDIFGQVSTPAPIVPNTTFNASNGANQLLQESTPPSIVAFDEEGVTTRFTFTKPNGPLSPDTTVQLCTTNSNVEPVTAFELAGATPRQVLVQIMLN